MNILHNIDDIRAEIMRLESAITFDQSAWDRVLGTLASLDRPYALADAMRRMDTARSNQRSILDKTIGEMYDEFKAEAARGMYRIHGLVWCGSDYASRGCCEFHQSYPDCMGRRASVAVETEVMA